MCRHASQTPDHRSQSLTRVSLIRRQVYSDSAMNLLVLNSGSSSVKYKLFDMRKEHVLAHGLLEQIGDRKSRLTHRWRTNGGHQDERITDQAVADHHQALERIGAALRETQVLSDPDLLDGIGHRVVHGGEAFREPVIITDNVTEAIRNNVPLAPLHNPANLAGVEVARRFAPRVPQVAVFDTAFHQSLPPHAYLYAIPHELYEHLQIRRYGFHGISHQYLTREAARLLERAEADINIITLHLGNGASIAAIRGGRSVDTSMGMTPLAGLMMGTRCGDLDPSIPFFLEQWTGQNSGLIEELLNRESGLKGICGASDMREIERLARAGDARARLAIDMYCYRIRKYIGGYLPELQRLDALVFTGGIGENSPHIRAESCRGLEHLGIVLDEDANNAPLDQAMEIQATGSGSRILVIRSDEELEIARQAMTLIAGTNQSGNDS